MKTDKLLHLVQQKKAMRSGGALPLPKHQSRGQIDLINQALNENRPQASSTSTGVPVVAQALNKAFNKEQDLARLSDEEFMAKYNEGKHKYQYNSNPQYRAEVDKRIRAAEKSGQPMIKQKVEVNPNMMFMVPSRGYTPETAQALVDANLETIGTALPVPGLEAVGKVPSVLKSIKNIVSKPATAVSNLPNVNNKTLSTISRNSEKWAEAADYLKRRQFIKKLQDARLVGKEFNLGDVNYAARSTDRTNKLTQLALDRYNTGFRRVSGHVPHDGLVSSGYRNQHGYDMNVHHYGRPRSEFENMKLAGVDFDDPSSIAEYQATHIPMEDYGYRATGESPTWEYGFLFRAPSPFHPSGALSGGPYLYKGLPGTDYSTGTYGDWFSKYYENVPKHIVHDKNGRSAWGWGRTTGETLTEPRRWYVKDPTMVGPRGAKAYEIDYSFPFTGNLSLDYEGLDQYIKNYERQYNTGWRGEYRQGGLAKAQDGLEPLVAEYKDLQDKINKGYGKESDYVKKLKQVSDKLIKEQFALETSGKVPESILNWKDPKTGEPAAFCIGTACYLANEAGDPFSYYSNTEAQQAAMRPESTRYLEQSEKYIEPGDIIQYKKGDSEKRRPSHAYTVLDIGEPDDRGFKPITVVGSGGHGPIHYRDYYLGPDNKIYGSPSNKTPMATQLLKRKSSGLREYNQIVSKRDELKKAIEAIQPDYFNPKPTVRSGDFLPTDFMFNKSGWYGGNPENYSFDLPDRDRTYALGPSGENRVAEQIYPKDAKLPEILSQISNPAYKQTFMEKHNISSREYDAIAKTMLGIYGAESKFGTDYWGTGKLPEPQGLSKFLDKTSEFIDDFPFPVNQLSSAVPQYGSVGPFQINRKNLSKNLRKKYSKEDLYNPIKASEATMEFLAEGLTPKGMNLRRRAKLDKDSERYMQNVNPENYLEYLSYLHNQPKWLTGDKSTMRTEGDIVAGEHPYKKLVDYYSGLFDVLPSSIAAPVEVVGERPAYEWKQKGGLAKAQYGLNTGFITYSQNPEYFNSKAVLSDNPEWNDKLKQLIYQGKAAYNPNTGAIQFIDSPAAPVDIQQMGTRDYTEGVRRDPTNPAYAGADDRTRQIIEQSTQEAYQNPLMYAPGTIGMTMLPVGFGMGYGLSQSAAQAGQGNYGAAALTAGLSTLPILPKFYKVLPEGTFAGYSKLQNPNKSYRVARMDAFDDFVESGVLRSRTPPSKPGMSFGEKMKLRSTGFPSFQKGYADFYYLRNKPGVVFETSLPTFKRGEINPVTGMRIKGSHYAHRVIDPETGNVLSSIPSEYISVYNAKPNWLKGFKKIDIPRTTIQQSNQKKNGGLAKAQYGWMTPPSLAPVAREVMKDEIVQPMPITGYQNLVNLSNKKRQEILNAYQLNNAFKDLSGETIELTADRYKGAKVPVEYITKMYDTAIEHGIDPYKLFALAGRESTFGSGFDAASKARKDSALNLVSGWNLAEDFLPYGVDRFLADRKVPGVKVYKGNKGWSYQVTDPKAVDKYLKENPRAYGQYMETLSSLPALGDQDAFDLASEFIKTKNISRYNPGDPDYANKIKQDYEILKRDPAFKKYVDSLRRRPTKQAAGGLTKAQNGLQYVPNGTYGNYYDPATQQYIPQVYLPDVDIVADRELPFQNGKFAPFLASRGIAEYVPAESIFLPGTPIVKGLGKVGNVLLDAVNPLAGMRGLKGARNVSKFEPIHSYDYYIAKQNRDNAYKRLQDLQNEMSTKVSVEKKSLEDITADIDDLNKSIKPRSEATTDDLQTLLNRFQNINKDLEKYIPKYKLLDSKAKNYDSKLATMLYEGNIPLSKQFPTRTLYNIQSGSSPIWKVNQDVNDYIQQLQFGKPKLEKPYYDFQLLRSVQNNLADEKLSEELIREQLLQEPLSKTVDYLGTPITFSPRASEYRLKMKDYPNRFTGIDAWRLGLNPNKDGGSTKSKLKKKVKINKPR